MKLMGILNMQPTLFHRKGFIKTTGKKKRVMEPHFTWGIKKCDTTVPFSEVQDFAVSITENSFVIVQKIYFSVTAHIYKHSQNMQKGGKRDDQIIAVRKELCYWHYRK